jgi:uncharacterized protein (TIGR01777 family)
MRVFITGGTGLVGSRLIARIRERQDSVVLLTRRPDAARERFGQDCTIVGGDPMNVGEWMDAVEDCDGVVNLAGEPIFGRRWNDEYKGLLMASRLQTTENVVQALARKPRTAAGSPKVLVNASAVGYYGPRGDEELTEAAPPGGDFLAQITITWEAKARTAETTSGVRVVLLRIGVVLDKTGGALAQMLPPFKWGIGGPIGLGKHWFSWIHNEDVVGLVLLALDNDKARGPINGTAPNPVTNKAFSKALGRALHRPSFLPVPPLALRLKFGQVAEVLTTGQRVLPRRALELGYQFKFPDIDLALQNILA